MFAEADAVDVDDVLDVESVELSLSSSSRSVDGLYERLRRRCFLACFALLAGGSSGELSRARERSCRLRSERCLGNASREMGLISPTSCTSSSSDTVTVAVGLDLLASLALLAALLGAVLVMAPAICVVGISIKCNFASSSDLPSSSGPYEVIGMECTDSSESVAFSSAFALALSASLGELLAESAVEGAPMYIGRLRIIEIVSA